MGATAASSANSMSLIFANFDIGSEAGEVEEPIILSGTQVDPFRWCVGAFYNSER